MAFPTEQCPNCDARVSCEAEYCSTCGAPAASAFSTCQGCRAAVGSDAAFCWQCGLKQDAAGARAFYNQRWRRSPTAFALRVDLAAPDETGVHGLQVDGGTLALVFQNGRFDGLLEPGYYPGDTFRQRLSGMDANRQLHAILLDSQAAEVDFLLGALQTQSYATVDVRLRLLFQVVEPRLFVTEFVKGASTLTTADLTRAFAGDVRAAVQGLLRDCTLEKLLGEFRVRELLEGEILECLRPGLDRCGLEATGVRLAELGGAAVNTLREKLGQVEVLNQQLEVDRRLRDALRREKVEAFRDEQTLQDYLLQVQHEFGLGDARRTDERRTDAQGREHRFALEGIRQNYERRHAEIINRLNEQKLQHQHQIAESKKDLHVRQLVFESGLAEGAARFEAGQREQLAQGQTAEQLAESGLRLFEKTERLKREAAGREAFLRLELEERQLQIRGNASLQALISTIGVEHADRLLHLAELEIAKGRTVEQSVALVSSRATALGNGGKGVGIDSSSAAVLAPSPCVVPDGDGLAVDLFLTYSRRDYEQVLALAEQLRAGGFTLWIDQRDIDGATYWTQEITEAIRRAKACLLFASTASFDSRHVMREVSLACEEHKPILPLRLEPVEAPPALRYHLAGIQYIDLYRGERTDNFERLLRALKRLGIVGR